MDFRFMRPVDSSYWRDSTVCICTCERGHRTDPAVVGMNCSETVGIVLRTILCVCSHRHK